jgi:leader peptidase (prepilin peptidase)/N-methyltransferase
VPLVSWLVQHGRCRSCAWRIPLRYPLVEALTAGLWLLAAWTTPADEPGLLAVRLLVLTGLVLATFVDLDCFEIPDSVSKGGMVLGPLLALAVPELFADSPIALAVSPDAAEVTRFGAFTASLAGLLLGGGILLAIGWVGDHVFGRESMGFGDVKLLAAGGGFVGAGGVVVALMIGSLLASLIGVLNMARLYVSARARARAIGVARSHRRAAAFARARGRYIPFGPYLAAGIGIVLLYWNDVLAWLV